MGIRWPGPALIFRWRQWYQLGVSPVMVDALCFLKEDTIQILILKTYLCDYEKLADNKANAKLTKINGMPK